jgi:4-hydroxy-tetrahydrodipicolinate synthase
MPASTDVPSRLGPEARGVYVISATPFTPEGRLDLDSTARLIEFYLGHGAHGLTILGILGEQQKLTPEESGQFIDAVLAQVAGRVPVIVGAASPYLDILQGFAARAMDAGAAGMMVAPMPGLRSDEQVYGFYAQVCQALRGFPLVLQDYPQTTGVYMSPGVICRIIDAFPEVVMLKHEDCPGLGKLSAVRRHCRDQGRALSILVGNGALHYPQELARGADGAMTGFSYPEMLVGVYERWRAGREQAAEDLFDAYLPLVRHELQPGIGLAVRKYVLARRGAMASDQLRMPGPRLTDEDRREVDRLIERLERRLASLPA